MIQRRKRARHFIYPSTGHDPPQTRVAKPDASAAAISDEKVWITESFEAAKKFAYHSPPIGHGSGPFQLSQKYQDDASTVAHERVALAAARLANLLNAALQ
jgi:hypothetical protein